MYRKTLLAKEKSATRALHDAATMPYREAKHTTAWVYYTPVCDGGGTLVLLVKNARACERERYLLKQRLVVDRFV